MRFSWGNCIILLLCYRTCQKYTKSFKTEKYCRNSPIMQYHSYHLITSCSQICISPSLRGNFLLSVIARGLSFLCHCEGIYARGNLLHGTSITLSLRGHLCPWQSPYMEQVLHCHCEGIYARGNLLHGASTATTPSSCLSFLRRYAPCNDGVTRGIMSLRGHLCPRQSLAWNKYSNYTVLMSEIASSLRSSQ